MDDNPWMPKQIQQWQTAYADKVGIAQVARQPGHKKHTGSCYQLLDVLHQRLAWFTPLQSAFFQLLQLFLELSAVHIWVRTGRRL